MENHNIKPDKITKPIQLLAVWLIGLILLVSALITAAATVKNPEWLPVFFSISSVAIIPLFLGLIFLLQTRFRPQLQEDEYYSKYLNENTKQLEISSTFTIAIESVEKRLDEKISQLGTITKDNINSINESILRIQDTKHPLDLNEDSSKTKNKKVDKLDNFIRESKTNIFLNVSLDQSRSIVNFVYENGLSISETFGSSNDKPNIFLMSIGDGTEPKILKFLINNLIQFGLQYLGLTSDTAKYNSIYIGSYAYSLASGKYKQVAFLDNRLQEKINDCETISEILEVIESNLKPL